MSQTCIYLPLPYWLTQTPHKPSSSKPILLMWQSEQYFPRNTAPRNYYICVPFTPGNSHPQNKTQRSWIKNSWRSKLPLRNDITIWKGPDTLSEYTQIIRIYNICVRSKPSTSTSTGEPCFFFLLQLCNHPGTKNRKPNALSQKGELYADVMSSNSKTSNILNLITSWVHPPAKTFLPRYNQPQL